MEYLTKRNVFFLDPSAVSDVFEHSPETVVLKIGKRTFDLGAYCFSKRDVKAHPRTGIKKVDVESHCAIRTENVRQIIRYYITAVNIRKVSGASIVASWFYIRNFLEWCEQSNHVLDLCDENNRRGVVKAYCENLVRLCRLDKDGTNRYANLQNAIIRLVSDIYEDDFIGHGIVKLKISASFQNSIEPPVEEAQAKSLDMCYALYEGYSEFFVKFARYPFQWRLPRYIGGSVWVFPCIVKFISPLDSERIAALDRPARAIDFENGCVRSMCDAENIYRNRETAATCRNLMLRTITKANSDPRHFRRLELAKFAMYAFALIFQARVGLNLAQLITMKWDGTYFISKTAPKFRVIKWRAGGVQQQYRVSNDFIPEFKKFVEFRTKLLGGWTCGYLFFHFNEKTGPKPFPDDVVQRFARIVSRVDPSFKLLRTREWRAAKSDFALATNPPSTAAEMLQNTSQTIAFHYANGRDRDARVQFKTFYERLSEVVVKVAGTLTNISVALCGSHGAPLAVDSASIQPDCTKEFGCFFCANFKVHASEEGVRKLLSCRYFVEKVSYLNPAASSGDNWYSPIIIRVNEVLEYIRLSSDELRVLVDKVERSVDVDEMLDPYWESRVQVLVELGIL